MPENALAEGYKQLGCGILLQAGKDAEWVVDHASSVMARAEYYGNPEVARLAPAAASLAQRKWRDVQVLACDLVDFFCGSWCEHLCEVAGVEVGTYLRSMRFDRSDLCRISFGSAPATIPATSSYQHTYTLRE